MNCPICLEQVNKNHSIWVCVTCKCVVHIKCFPKIGDAVNTRHGCPQCRTRLDDLARKAKQSMKAPMGCFCFVCKTEIWEGDSIIRCPSPEAVCVGSYHQTCYRGKCEACQKNPGQVFVEMRNSKLAEVQAELSRQS